MQATLTKLMKKSLNSPDTIRQFGSGQLEIVTMQDTTIGRITLRPGWRWSKDVKPLAGTDSCQLSHVNYVISGRLAVRSDGGQQIELQAGDAAVIPPGHDAWVLGNEPCIQIDFSGAAEYGRSDVVSFHSVESMLDYEE